MSQSGIVRIDYLDDSKPIGTTLRRKVLLCCPDPRNWEGAPGRIEEPGFGALMRLVSMIGTFSVRSLPLRPAREGIFVG